MFFVNKVKIILFKSSIGKQFIIVNFPSIGASITPNLLSGRCLFIFLLLSSLIIINSYTSALVSNLVKSNSKNKIKTIKDLEKSHLKIGFEEIPYIHSFLNVSDSFFRSEEFYMPIFDDELKKTLHLNIFMLVNARYRIAVFHIKKG